MQLNLLENYSSQRLSRSTSHLKQEIINAIQDWWTLLICLALLRTDVSQALLCLLFPNIYLNFFSCALIRRIR
jgi:hypothetical protein